MDGGLDSSFARLRMQLVHLGQVVVGIEGVLFALKLVAGLIKPYNIGLQGKSLVLLFFLISSSDGGGNFFERVL